MQPGIKTLDHRYSELLIRYLFPARITLILVHFTALIGVLPQVQVSDPSLLPSTGEAIPDVLCAVLGFLVEERH